MKVLACLACFAGFAAVSVPAQAEDVKIVRYLVPNIKLYNAAGKWQKTLPIAQMPTPPVLVENAYPDLGLVEITVDGQKLSVMEGQVQLNRSACPTGYALGPAPRENVNAGDNAGSSQGTLGCVPVS